MVIRRIIVVCLLLVSFVSPEEHITVWLVGDSTMADKEVKAYPETGWGMPFSYFFDSAVRVDNRAKNGRSTKSFISEGRWDAVEKGMRAGDYVLIQFGHNDEVPTKKTYTTPAEFEANLVKFVAAVRDRKGVPVLITPVARRKFDTAGHVVETHEQYAGLVRKVAVAQRVALIDLDKESQALLQRFGPEASKVLFNYLSPGEHPNYPEGRQDDTHFSELGARKMAEIVLADIRALKLGLAGHIGVAGAAGVPAATLSKRMVVAADGSGDYRTVQAAFDAVPLWNNKPVVIDVRRGVYREKLHLDSGKNFVRLTGESRFNTILTYDDHPGMKGTNGDSINTRNSYSFRVSADDFSATNITFRNDAGFSAGQAVAVEARGDRLLFENCRIIGNQDILFLNSEKSRQYYQNCYIAGTTDFIFGAATAWFSQCHIHSKKNSHVTAASTPAEHRYGFVFYDCTLTADTGLNRVSLGRPWRPYASVTWLHCYIGAQIFPGGWANWNKTDNYKTARYAEFEDYGPGADPTGRVSWARQLGDAEAAGITVGAVLGDWNPLKVEMGQ
ncbi:MAG TPA: pectinesterase family protein [Puia sp.]|jgi:pectinesterase